MTFPTDNPTIPDADDANFLSNMHTTLSHTEATNAIIAKVHAIAAKLGVGASTAAANQVLRGTGAGTTDFGPITNAYIDAAAAIAYSKLNLATSITNGDIAAAAAIALSKLAATTSGLVRSNGTVMAGGATVVNADVDAAAAIALTKLGAMDTVQVEANTGANQSIPDSTHTAITWQSAVYDPLSMFNAGSPTYVTVPKTGIYLVQAFIFWTYNTGGRRQQVFGVIGSGAVSGYNSLIQADLSSDPLSVPYVGIGRITTAPAQVGVQVWQNSGGALTLNNSWGIRMSVTRIGSY